MKSNSKIIESLESTLMWHGISLSSAEAAARDFAMTIERRITEVNIQEYRWTPSIEEQQTNFEIALGFTRALVKLRLMKI